MKNKIPFIICVLAIIGLADSTYLALVHYNIVEYALPSTGSTCNFTAGSCESLVRYDQTLLFGIPNSMLGIAYYTVITAVAFMRIYTRKWPAHWLLLGFIFGSLLFSVYLVHLLIYVIHIPCPFCLAAHAINLTIALLYMVSLHQDTEIMHPVWHA